VISRLALAVEVRTDTPETPMTKAMSEKEAVGRMGVEAVCVESEMDPTEGTVAVEPDHVELTTRRK
jgi:hypothetical protein